MLNDAGLQYFYNRLGEIIRDARLEAGISQEVLADHLGLSRVSVVNIEKGRQKIQVHSLIEILHFLKISNSEFFDKAKSAIKLEIDPELEKEVRKKVNSEKSEDAARIREFISFTIAQKNK